MHWFMLNSFRSEIDLDKAKLTLPIDFLWGLISQIGVGPGTNRLELRERHKMKANKINPKIF